MKSDSDESGLVEKLCTEILGVRELKEICRIRGFPATTGAKQEMAASTAARFLDPLGVPEAMAAIGGEWLCALHMIAASKEPVPAGLLGPVVLQAAGRHSVDYPRLWRALTVGLLSKGVVLVDDLGPPARWAGSRLARFRLLLPAEFRRHIPPFPVPADPLRGEIEQGSAEATFGRAMEEFVSRAGLVGKKGPHKPSNLAGQLAAEMALENDRLGLRGAEGPTAPILARRLHSCWERSLVHRRGYEEAPITPGREEAPITPGREEAPITPGRMVSHILATLPAGTGCTAADLADALSKLGLAVGPEKVQIFCDDGAAAGLLRRCRAGGDRVLYASLTQTERSPGGPWALALERDRDGARVDLKASTLAAILEAAAVSRTSLRDGSLVMAPDPIRLGRAWDRLQGGRTLAALRNGSPAFEEAARRVEERIGQVVVHHGLTVIRMADVGLRALVRARFPAAIREMGGEYVAVLSGRTEDVLAFTRKEGYVARMVE